MTASLNCVILTQVLALLLCPDLQNDDRFPQDAKRRAKRILDDMIGQTIGNTNYGFLIIVEETGIGPLLYV